MLKRLYILDALKERFEADVPQEVLDEVLPGATSDVLMSGSKREWDYCVSKARRTLCAYVLEKDQNRNQTADSDKDLRNDWSWRSWQPPN